MAPVDVQRINVRGVVPCPVARYRHRLIPTPPSRARRRAHAATKDAHQSPDARDACEEAAFTAHEAMDGSRRRHRGISHTWHGYPVQGSTRMTSSPVLGTHGVRQEVEHDA
jgi:hypothetical protein